MSSSESDYALESKFSRYTNFLRVGSPKEVSLLLGSLAFLDFFFSNFLVATSLHEVSGTVTSHRTLATCVEQGEEQHLVGMFRTGHDRGSIGQSDATRVS